MNISVDYAERIISNSYNRKEWKLKPYDLTEEYRGLNTYWKH